MQQKISDIPPITLYVCYFFFSTVFYSIYIVKDSNANKTVENLTLKIDP